MRHALRDDTSAVSQIYGFLVSGVIFVGAAGGILAWSQFAGQDPGLGEQAARDVDADSIASLLLASQGQGWADPDALERLGLMGPDGSLDGARLAMLSSSLEASDNDLVDYEEARAAFGIGSDAGFNMRITPLSGDVSLQGHDFDYLHALYIGDWNSIASITLSTANATILNANTRLNDSMATATLWERQVLEGVGVDFDNQMHMTTTTPAVLVQITTVPDVKIPLLTYLGLPVWDGDVLYDNKQYLDSVLPGKLATGGYDLIVVGAGIDHSALTSNAVKGSIEDFVRGGGTLMVFGSSGGNYNWMQPLFDVSAASVSGAVTASDPAQDILDRPWTLAWAQYDTQGLAWEVDEADFDIALRQGGEAVLAVSKPGAVDDGSVFLTSYKSSVVGQALGAAEAQHLMFNMLLYRDAVEPTNLSFFFGPDAPTDRPVSSSVRTMTLDHPDLGRVPVRVEVLAWGTR